MDFLNKLDKDTIHSSSNEYINSNNTITANLELKYQNLLSELELVAYVISHDLRKPLREVNNALEDLSEHTSNLSPAVKDIIDEIKVSSKDMHQMLTAMMEYIRLGLFPPELKPVNSHDIVTEVLASKKEILEKFNIEVKLDRLPMVMSYQKHLTSLFSELIENAIKFRNPDKDPQLSISSEKINDKIKFSVWNNGITVDEEYYEIIFLLFQRLFTKEEIPGLGAGLALCKKIVESEGGSIWIESSDTTGTSINFLLNAA